MVGETIPDFTAQNQFGNTFSLSQEKKQNLFFIRDNGVLTATSM